MSTINKTNVVNGNTILANDILNVINALDGTAGTSIVITADLKQGTTNTTDNVTSHAEGDTTTATGTYSHAEGLSTQATGDYSHAEGAFTRATGYGSHTEGTYTTASGQYSHAEGFNTVASGLYQHVQGQYNQSSSAQSAFIVGNGTGTGASRSNLIFASGSQVQVTGSVIATAGFTGSLLGTASFATTASNIQGGTANYIPIWTTATTISSSTIYQLAGSVGIGTTTPNAKLDVNGNAIVTGSLRVTGSLGVTGSFNQASSSLASGLFSHVQGFTVTASGIYSHAEGYQTQAIGNYSHAEGSTTQASGSISHAEGAATQAIGGASHAEGAATQAIGDYSHTEGANTLTGIQTAYSSSVSGGLVTLDTVYGDVTATFTAGDLLYLYDNEFDQNYGSATFIIDTVSFSASKTKVQLVDTSVETTKAYVGDLTYLLTNFTFGGNKTIPGNYSHAEGQSTFAIGDYSHTEGYATQAIGASSHAEGRGAQIVGGYSHAEGQSTQAIGVYSHAEGVSTQAIGGYSHAEGGSTQAIEDYSHAEGDSTIASGESSHAEGRSTQAVGNYSHAEGRSTQAIGETSHAEGFNTIASGSYQHVSGKYNTQGDATSLFIVGNGTGDGTRLDAFKVTHSSSIVVNQIKNAPTWTGSAGEMVPADIAGNYYLYMWVGAAGWKRATFT